MVTLGGSITEGGGSRRSMPPWPTRTMSMLNGTFPNRVSRLVNGARGASQSTYMSMCAKVGAGMGAAMGADLGGSLANLLVGPT